MKRFLIISILIVFNSQLLFSQEPDSIRYWGKGITDSVGRKQGYWKYYRDMYYYGFEYEKQTVPLSEGFYKENKKSGKWTYYYDCGTKYCWEQIIWEDHFITYYNDGSSLYEDIFGKN